MGNAVEWRDVIRECQEEMDDPELITSIFLTDEEPIDVEVNTEVESLPGGILKLTYSPGEIWYINTDRILFVNMVLG